MTNRRILLATFGSFGDLHPYLGLGLELKARGYEAVVATSELYRAKVESTGLAFRPMRPDLPNASEAGEFARRVMDERRGTGIVIRELALGHLRQSYDDLSSAAAGCGLIVSHALTYAAPLIAERMNIPWVFVALQPIILFSAEDPSILPQAPWVIGLRQVLGARGYRQLMNLGMQPIRAWAEPIYELRSELSLPPPRAGNPILRGQYSPHLNLALFSRALSLGLAGAYRASRFRFLRCQRCDASADERAAAAVRRERRDAAGLHSRDCGGSTCGRLFQESVAAARLIDRRAVLPTGVDTGNAGEISMADDVIAADYAPFHELMLLASINIHQGGIGTTGQAMRAGKPLLVVPFAHDQLDNAAGCARLAIAERLQRRSYKASVVAKRLSGLLWNSQFAANARAASKVIAQEKGAVAACDAVEKLLLQSA